MKAWDSYKSSVMHNRKSVEQVQDHLQYLVKNFSTA